MAIGDRLRGVADAVRARVRAFSVEVPRRFPGVGLQQPLYPPTNPRTEEKIAGRDALEARITIGAGPMLDRYSTYPATALDPLKIEAILKAADLGVVYRYADMCHQVLQRDTHLFGVDRGRRQAVVNKPFLIQPSREGAIAKALSHYMRAVVDGIDGYQESLYELHSKNCVGYSCGEIVWRPGRVRFPGPKGVISLTGLFPRSIEWVHGKHFQFKADSDEPLLDLGNDGCVHLPRHKFIFCRAPGDGIASTRGYIRSVVWLHFLKHCGLRDWAVFLHLYGIPQLWGRVERGLWQDPKMRAVLKQALVDYGTGKKAPVLPDGLSIEAKDGPIGSGAGDAHAKLIAIANYEISKAVQGETLTSEPGQSGSYNLGIVHADSKHEVVVGDAVTTAADLRADLFVSAIELNIFALADALGAPPEELLAAVPRDEFRTDRETSPRDRAEIIKILSEAGLKVSVSQLRREYGLDTPTDDDDVLPGKPVTVSAGGAVAGSTDAAEGIRNPNEQKSGAAPKLPAPPPAPGQPPRRMVAFAQPPFEEDEHPRDQDGKFAPKGEGSTGSGAAQPAPAQPQHGKESRPYAPPTDEERVETHHALDHVPELAHELGHPNVSRAAQHVTDRHVMEHLLHDEVFNVIGHRDSGKLVAAETVHVGDHDDGLFPGDGEHHPGMVHVRRYAYPNGVVTIKRNHNALKIHAHRGSLDKPDDMREIVKFKLRDKRFDGTKQADESPLTDWPYSNPSNDHAYPHSVELSIYSRDPARYHGDVHGDKKMEQFLFEPFTLAGGSDQFLPMWKRAFEMAGDPKDPIYPGQGAPSQPGVAGHFTAGVEPLLRQLGYTRVDNLPSHWNVVHFLKKQGYNVDDPEDERRLREISEKLKDLNRQRAVHDEPPLTKAQESWIVLLQNRAFRAHGVPPSDLDLGAEYPLWMNDDGSAKNIWMSRRL